jgi:hypothetical protein
MRCTRDHRPKPAITAVSMQMSTAQAGFQMTDINGNPISVTEAASTGIAVFMSPS